MIYRPISIRLKPAVHFLEDYFSPKEISSLFEAKGCDAELASRCGYLFLQVARALVEAGADPHSQVHACWVPGRIEVLGKHTDYAGGQSLLVASERGIAVLVLPDEKPRLLIVDALNEEAFETNLVGETVGTPPSWAIYPQTATRRIAANFGQIQSGGTIAFASNLPPAAGMSSSSALVVAVTLALQKLARFDKTDLFREVIRAREAYADYMGHIENGKSYKSLDGEKGVGTDGGSQDHLAIMCARQNEVVHASFLPTQVIASFKLPANLTFCIGCSGVKARKAAGARRRYNDAATLAASVLHHWNRRADKPANSLGEMIKEGAFERDRVISELLSVNTQLALRLEQFFNEVKIYIPKTIRALEMGDYELLGKMVDASQSDAARCLGNQVEETMFLATSARDLGAVAASSFGAGFGGGVWAMVERDRVAAFLDRWSRQYFEKYPRRRRARFFEEKTGPAAHYLAF